MDGNKVIENLLERIKGLTKENAFLIAQLQSIEEEKKNGIEGDGQNVE
jgi:hypothetical protein